MGQDNYITVVGNLTRDPELRQISSGASVANLGLAVNRRWRNASTNEWEEQTSFFDVSCWNELATNVAASLTTGTRVMVSGRLEQRTWTTENGDNRSKVEIRADEIGACLRWATVDVTRNERSGSSFGAQGHGGEPVPAMAGAASSSAGAGEEPF